MNSSFFECASMFEENWVERSVANSLREHATGVGKGIVVEKTYCIEGNIVDRASNKNGKGWCEDVSPTLNTQDRHAVCCQLADNVKCLNPWDPNGIRQYDADGCFATLRANSNGGQNRQGVVYGVVSKGNGEAFITENRHTSLSIGGGQAGQGYPAVLYENDESVHN